MCRFYLLGYLADNPKQQQGLAHIFNQEKLFGINIIHDE